MKYSKFGLAAVIIAAFIIFTSCNTIEGNGDLMSSERIVSAFEKIHSGSSVIINFHISQEYRAVVTADSNLIKFVTTTVRNNTLNIGVEKGVYSFTKLTVDVYSPVLTGVSISGSGSFDSNDRITASVFEANISGSGKVKVIIESKTFTSGISGSGNMIISGNNNDLNIMISGSGKFNGNEFINNNAIVDISGSGTATFFVTDNLNARISGSGRLNYRGNPSVVNTNVTGSGQINKL